MSNLFNKVIGQRQFNFQSVEYGNEIEYHVNVKDEEGVRWEFRMFRTDDKWKLEGEKLPSWITELETAIGKSIDEHE